jgi:tetratricopeptide (TPR) repeat protein
MFRLILGLAVALVSAPSAVSAQVAEGISWIHSFEYERALAAFERAERADPRDAMAYWGQAMCYEQLLWGNENVEEARSIVSRMRRSGALGSADAKARAWAGTLEALFGPFDSARGPDERPARIAAYADAMARMAAAYPDDPDVAAFHGLAVMATRSRGLAGHQGHDEPMLVGSAEQQRAAEIFARILEKHPKHPGALHYLIHAWDDPANAHKALDAARVYATVVPESSHARHMPAHVFVQLGMWPEAIASDEAAADAADVKVAKDGLPVTAADFHPLSWLVYEYTQAGRFDDARRALERLRAPAEATRDPRLLSMLGSLRSRVAIEAGAWDELPGPGFVNYDELFAVGFSAAQRGDTALAEQARIRLGEMARTPRYAERRQVLEIMAMQVGGAIRMRSGDVDGALALLADAAAAERALPSPIGPPVLIKPAQEQYAEALLEAGRAAEAVAQYDAALARARNRRLSVEGRARAAAAASSAPPIAAWPIGAGLVTVIVAVAVIRRRRRAA